MPGRCRAVDIQIDRLDESVRIRVVDDGRGAAADDDGPGYGLVGMHERVEAIGGHLAAGWRVGGGWSVTADLPFSARPAADHSTERQVIR